MTLGESIKMYREKAQLTQTELGERIGVSQQMIAFCERDLKKPNIDMIVRMSKIFHCTTDDLLIKHTTEHTA